MHRCVITEAVLLLLSQIERETLLHIGRERVVKMSSFAKKQLEKMGWKEGQGLGKNGSGITTYIRVQKRDPTLQSGLGHEAGKLGADNSDMGYESILSSIANKTKRREKTSTPSNVRVQEGVEDALESDEETTTTVSSSPIKKPLADEEHSSNPRPIKRQRNNVAVSSSSSSSSDDDDNVVEKQNGSDVLRWTDAQLLERCGGVRLGRAGRHRFFDGKLNRIDASHATEK